MRLIDADELVAELIYLYEDRGWHEREIHFSLADIRCNVDMIPTVDAVPHEDYKSMESTVNKLTQALANSEKHGHWTYERLTDTNGGSYSVVRCSNCQARVPWVTKYCSYCGAKMDEVTDEID